MKAVTGHTLLTHGLEGKRAGPLDDDVRQQVDSKAQTSRGKQLHGVGGKDGDLGGGRQALGEGDETSTATCRRPAGEAAIANQALLCPINYLVCWAL